MTIKELSYVITVVKWIDHVTNFMTFFCGSHYTNQWFAMGNAKNGNKLVSGKTVVKHGHVTKGLCK